MIPVVDVFAGPGGLNEGFSALRHDGKRVFDVVASFEMEPRAVDTLMLRSAVRALSDGGPLYGPYRRFLDGESTLQGLREDPGFRGALGSARGHVHQLELGPANREAAAERITKATRGDSNWVLVGGPPCQAYSMAGRSRRTNDPNFAADHKHFLYREYLDILSRFKPPVFVMENVKGLLSAGHGGERMFEKILGDLKQGGLYDIRSMVTSDPDPERGDYVVRAERYGIPQKRHRVFLVGVHRDLSDKALGSLPTCREVTVRQAIGALPAVVPGVTRTDDQEAARLRAHRLGASRAATTPGNSVPLSAGQAFSPGLHEWLNPHGVGVTLHDPRSHMESDLARYRYLAELASRGIRQRVQDFPKDLRPNHRNLSGDSTPFSDRFKVQDWDGPSGTIASHIAKDGHHYIHPDPSQMRSLTVREAARLQTFPDDYYFVGNRTSQYHQVGNAVPPLLAHKIAGLVAGLLD